MALTAENGWHLSAEGVELCEGQLQKALDMDLREIGCGILSEEINRGKQDTLQAGFVLQVTKIRNISAPKANEDSGAAPRMLKVSMTDGKTTVHGIEISKIDGLGLNTPPGTKVKLVKEISMSNGFLHLETGSLKVLGGRVEALVTKWEVSKELEKFSKLRSSRQDRTEGSAPPWIPFGKKIIKEPSSDKAFKAFSQDAANPATPKENAEFDNQRQDAILEATKISAPQKVFGAGSKDIREAEVPKKRKEQKPSDKTDDNQAEMINGGDNSGRGGRKKAGKGRNSRENDVQAAGQAKPSGSVSLFAFLEEKLPGDVAGAPEPKGRNADVQKSKFDKTDRPERPERSAGQQSNGRGRGGRSDYRASDKVQSGYNDQAGFHSSQSRRRGGGPERRGGRTDPRQVSDRGGHERRGRGGPGRGGTRGGRNADRDFREREEPAYEQSKKVEKGDKEKKSSVPHSKNAREDRDGLQDGGQRSGFSQNGRDFGEWNNSTYHNTQRHRGGERQQPKPTQPSQSDVVAKMSNLQVGDGQLVKEVPAAVPEENSRHQFTEPPPSQPVKTSKNANNWGHVSSYQMRQGGANQVWGAPPSLPLQQPRWGIGDECLARYWEDNKYYPVRLTAVTAKTAVVLFKDYGNYEEVYLQDLLPLPGASPYRSSVGFIPTTPGLPPAFPH